MVILKVFILFLKQESELEAQRLKGSELEGPMLEDFCLVTLKNLKKTFRRESHATSKVKELFNFSKFRKQDYFLINLAKTILSSTCT